MSQEKRKTIWKHYKNILITPAILRNGNFIVLNSRVIKHATQSGSLQNQSKTSSLVSGRGQYQNSLKERNRILKSQQNIIIILVILRNAQLEGEMLMLEVSEGPTHSEAHTHPHTPTHEKSRNHQIGPCNDKYQKPMDTIKGLLLELRNCSCWLSFLLKIEIGPNTYD